VNHVFADLITATPDSQPEYVALQPVRGAPPHGPAVTLLGADPHEGKPRADELVYAVIGVPAQAAIHHKDAIIKAARESVDSVMLCSEPFSVAYGQDMLDDVLVIDIGAGTTDLCRMHGTMPEESDQITNTFAGDFVDEELSKEIRKVQPEAQFTGERYGAARFKVRQERLLFFHHKLINAMFLSRMPINGLFNFGGLLWQELMERFQFFGFDEIYFELEVVK
jgi:hypothetical protein